jgi:outer membrane protein
MKTAAIILLTLITTFAQAQDRIAYADVEYIFNKLPEGKQIEAELKSLQAQLESQLKAKYGEFRKKYDFYAPRERTMTPEEVERARKELQTLQDDLKKFEQDSDTRLQLKHKQLMEPVTQKIQKAISEVAQEKGYDFILSAGAGRQDLILFADDQADVSDQILEKLGVSPDIASQR